MKWIVSGLLLLALNAHADTLRCGNLLIQTGDSTHMVRSRCGDPDSVDKYTAPDYGAHYWYDRYKKPVRQKDIGVKEVWFYDRGSNQLNARLTFINGELTQIDMLGYGSK